MSSKIIMPDISSLVGEFLEARTFTQKGISSTRQEKVTNQILQQLEQGESLSPLERYKLANSLLHLIYAANKGAEEIVFNILPDIKMIDVLGSDASISIYQNRSVKEVFAGYVAEMRLRAKAENSPTSALFGEKRRDKAVEIIGDLLNKYPVKITATLPVKNYG